MWKTRSPGFQLQHPTNCPRNSPTKESCKITVDSSPVTTGTVDVSQPFKSSSSVQAQGSKCQVKDDGEQAENKPQSCFLSIKYVSFFILFSSTTILSHSSLPTIALSSCWRTSKFMPLPLLLHFIYAHICSTSLGKV